MKTLLAAGALLLASATAHAQYAELPQGFYVGAGYADVKVSLDALEDSAHLDAGRLYAGYHFAQPFALEVSYVQPELERDRFGPVSTRYEAKGGTAAVIGHLPLGGAWQLLGTLGIAAWDEKLSVRTSTSVTETNASDIDILYGAGLSASFSRIWIRGMYERAETTGGSIGAWSASVVFRF